MNAEITEKRGRGRPPVYKSEIEKDLAFRESLRKYYYGERRNIMIERRKQNSKFISKADLLEKLKIMDISEEEKNKISKYKKKKLQETIENLEANTQE